MGENSSIFQRQRTDREMIYGVLRKINFFGFLWVMSLAALGSWVGVMWSDNQPPIEYAEEGANILPDPAEDGGRVLIHFPIRRNRSCPGYVYRQLRDATNGRIIAVYDPIPAVQMSLGDNVISKTFLLPEGLPSRVKYQARICFTCNVLQHITRPICVSSPDVVFSVEPKKEEIGK